MPQLKITLLIVTALSLCVFSLFLGPTFMNPLHLSVIDKHILLSIRLPRVIVAFLMGAALGSSGAVLQGILRNPLADPYILGISSGAALTASLSLLWGASILIEIGLPASALCGALLTSFIVGAFGWKRGGIWPERLLLAGIGLGFLFHAVLMMLVSASTNEAMRRALMWIFGDLSMADWSVIPYGGVFVIVGLCIALLRTKALNALLLGDELAHSLGFAPQKERFLFFVSVSIMTAASVSLGGTIGFIGLIVPHIVRFFAGEDSRFLLPFSALFGGTFLCISDLIGRTILAPTEVPSGIVTALIGSPYFLYLLRRRDVFRA